MEITIGRCGVACGMCGHFNHGCLGCIKENMIKKRCLVFICAEKKNNEFCIKCPEFPCKLMRGLSKAYCPVFTDIRID